MSFHPGISSRRPLAMLIALAITAASSTAAAENGADPATAQVLFEAAMKLMQAGNHAAACPKLEESQRLDPGMGTQFRLAECYASIGRLAQAWALFLDVADQAKREGLDKREKQARQRADELAPRLPKLTIHVNRASADLDGFELTRDGTPIGKSQWDLAVPIDPGEHVVSATAKGYVPWQKTINSKEGASIELTIPALEAAPKTEAAPTPTPTREIAVERGMPWQRIGAIAVGALGVAGIVVGSIEGANAQSQWKDALNHCGGEPNHCGPMGLELGQAASTSATISTIGFVVGGAAVAGGVLLWLTAPSPGPSSSRTGLWLAPSGKGAILGGRF